ncbi:nucleoside triphosphate pyrophosphohydrolase [Thermoanaerobacter wiegelii]|uniref:MazG family protein n=1 Tax=Thermoanaerobacter wiegelii Rt8.B1 TaxID=697303 RepID=G2MRR5_9THEO|nr:nucleoside triphosphate pyrophosphohydrolase [Thermoanaerobacter wiegelii]AEM79796.1 MazG family protein [Thermoanaerobacter wiegelii Rt8.B1]
MNKLFIVGLGPGSPDTITVGVLEKMKRADKVFLRTEKHPIVSYLKEQEIIFETFDKIYEKSMTFEEVYENIAREIIDIARKYRNVVYAVPGHPHVAEKSVEYILNFCKDCADISVEVIPAVSFIDAIISDLKIDPIYGLKIIDALSLDTQKPDKRCHNIVVQIYDKFVASEAKLKLSEIYGDNYLVILIKNAGINGRQVIETMPLYMIDRIDWIDYLTSLYIPPVQKIFQEKYDIYDLLEIMRILRSEKGCPWDKEQTHQSLEKYLVEESYELIDAIEKESEDKMAEELGDVLLQVVFHSQIAKERGTFNFCDVVDGICKKMIWRHPHVFGTVELKTSKAVLEKWDELKREEKDLNSYTEVLKDVPKHMPALIRSYKVQEKAAKVGFDWERVEDAISKVYEELEELKEVYKGKDKEKIIEEVGDLIFAVVNVARFLDVEPESATHNTVEKFIKRFEYIEKTAAKNGQKLDEMTLDDMDKLWNEAKMNKFDKKNEK